MEKKHWHTVKEHQKHEQPKNHKDAPLKFKNLEKNNLLDIWGDNKVFEEKILSGKQEKNFRYAVILFRSAIFLARAVWHSEATMKTKKSQQGKF